MLIIGGGIGIRIEQFIESAAEVWQRDGLQRSATGERPILNRCDAIGNHDRGHGFASCECPARNSRHGPVFIGGRNDDIARNRVRCSSDAIRFPVLIQSVGQAIQCGKDDTMGLVLVGITEICLVLRCAFDAIRGLFGDGIDAIDRFFADVGGVARTHYLRGACGIIGAPLVARFAKVMA